MYATRVVLMTSTWYHSAEANFFDPILPEETYT